MNKCYNSNYIKYLIILGILYVLLKIIPNPKLQKKDIILILIIVVFTMACVDFNNKKIIDNFLNTSETKQEMVHTDHSKTIANKQFNAMYEAHQAQMHQDQNQEPEPEPEPEQQIPLTKDMIEIKYYNMLINQLSNKGILSQADINNLKLKMESKLFTIEEIIASLETLAGNDNMPKNKQHKKKQSQSCQSINDDIIYNELLPMQMKTIGGETPNTWSGNYAILNTDKWTVPMTRPPVCINTNPCPVCPSDNNTSNLTGLADWDNSRTVSTTTINQNWAKNQTNPMN